MKFVRAFSLVLLPLFVMAVILASHVDADAKRFGGGRSFGSKSSFSKSYSKPVTKQNSFSQNKAATGSNTQQPRRGLFGGMGGLFGGLLAGSLLGSLLFGGGFGGGFGMFDMLFIFLIIMFAMRFFRNRREGAGRSASYSTAQQGSYEQPSYSGYESAQSNQYRQAESAWDHLRSDSASGSTQQAYNETAGPEIPAGFDADEFMKGAKMVFSRLQASWDARDMDDIKQFTTQDVYEEIRKQAQDDPTPSKTEILMVNARLLEVKEEGSETQTTVYFDALMREEANAAQPEQVREVWHFLRKDGASGMWLLDGIQQLED